MQLLLRYAQVDGRSDRWWFTSLLMAEIELPNFDAISVSSVSEMRSLFRNTRT